MQTRIQRILTSTPSIATGIGGNVYVFGSDRDAIVQVCIAIQKSPRSIVFHDRHQCWMFRVKSQTHKRRIKLLNAQSKQCII